jgi:hypothetical protein
LHNILHKLVMGHICLFSLCNLTNAFSAVASGFTLMFFHFSVLGSMVLHLLIVLLIFVDVFMLDPQVFHICGCFP